MNRSFGLLLLLLLLSGCGEGERGRGTVELWTLQLSPTFDPFINGLISEFESAHPGVKIRWVDVPFEGITQKLLSSVPAGDPPDLVNLPADYVRKYADLGVLRPVEGLIPESTASRHLYESVRPLRRRGGTYGLPWYLATKILVIDSARMRRDGFQEHPHGTYGDLIQLSREYHRRTGRFAFSTNLAADSYLLQIFVSEGVPLLDPGETRGVFATPAGREVLKEWVDLFQEGALPRECILTGHRGGLDLFQSGGVMMFVGAPQFLRIIRENAPRIYATTDVAPVPVGSAGLVELDVMALSISSKCRDPRATSEFIQFLTAPEQQLRFSRIVPIFPSQLSALEDPFFSDSTGGLEAKARSIAARQLRRGVVMKPMAGKSNRLTEAFKDGVLKAFLGTLPPDRALEETQRRWDAILKESRHE